MTTVRFRRSAAAAAAIALQALPAAACGYDGLMADLTAAHPRSLEVALAVREALDRQQLQDLEAAPPALGFMRARQMLLGFAPQVATAAGVSTGSVAVLLVESGLWTRYTLGPGAAAPQPHVAGPLAGERVLVTSEAVLSALLQGQMPLSRAAELGLVVRSLPG